MLKVFGFIGNLLTKVESWIALGSMVVTTGAFAWLIAQWELLASQGWAAILLFAVICSAIFAIAVCLVFLASQRWLGGRTTVTSNQVSASQGSITANPQPLEMVQDTTFENRTVQIDGKHFVKCVFKECTIQYDGGPYQLTECRREAGAIMFGSGNLSIVRAMPLMQFIGLLSADAKGGIIHAPKV